MITYALTQAPPSLNNAFSNVGGVGRVKSKPYKAWLTAAGWEIKGQGLRQFQGDYALDIEIGRNTSRADIDNLIKPISDLLVSMKVTDDDSAMQRVSIARTDRMDVLIRVEAA